MRIEDAHAAARHWVAANAAPAEGFRGAYFTGSTVGLALGAEVPLGSDVDVMVVSSAPVPEVKIGKFLHRGALLEVSHLPWDEVSSAEQVLGDYHLAAGLRADTVFADPLGDLRAVQRAVARHFSGPAWVRHRVRHALRRVEAGLTSLDVSAPWPDLVTSWLFPTGVTTHVLLVADQRNPTVRLRYPAAREVLRRHRLTHTYDELLRLLGCAGLDAGRVGHHLAALAQTFDATAEVARTPFFFSSDITAAARPIAVDGLRELIDRGDHREAVFWIVATFARCHKILAADAPPGLQDSLRPAFDDVLADLGVTSPADLVERAATVLDFLPALTAAAETVMGGAPPPR